MRTSSLRQIKTALIAMTVAAINAGMLYAQQASPSLAPTDLSATITAIVSEPSVSRAHWGIVVTSLDGSSIFSLNEGQFFQPASNAKLFTTAAALALMSTNTFDTRLIATGLSPAPDSLAGDLVLKGDGDANLSGRTIPYASPAVQSKPTPPLHYLEEMADAVFDSGLKRIDGDIIGDDTLFPWEPYATDWAIDDAVWGYGAPVSALTINDNQIKLTITPSVKAGEPALVTLDPAVPYYTIETSGLTTSPARTGSHIEIERSIGSKVLRIYGTIAVAAPADMEEIAIDDPAQYAAITLKSLLEARGITVSGAARPAHRAANLKSAFLAETRETIAGFENPVSGSGHGRAAGVRGLCIACDPKTAAVDKVLASHVSPTVAEDVVVTNKESQNLHAELLLRQMGAAVGTDGSIAQGARVVRSFLIAAGINKDDFVFYDGSGLSGHDLITPRAVAKLLQFASTQPWFATYKASLPIGGVDGSLESRFTKPPLKGHVFAKTGTLGEARALSGYLECASGRTVIFSILTGNHAPGTRADREVMDRIVAAIAAAN